MYKRSLIGVVAVWALALVPPPNYACAQESETSLPRDLLFYPFIEEAPFNPRFRLTTGDTLSPRMQAAVQYRSTLNPGLRAAGAIVLYCWSNIEEVEDHWNFGKKVDASTIEQLAEILDSNQSLIIGIRGGTCSPNWLRDHGVPMPTFLNQFRNCEPMTLGASYEPYYVERYLKAVRAMWSELAKYSLRKDPTQSLQDRVVAIRNGEMVSSTSGEMGIFSQGCKDRQSQFEVAKIWSDNGYTPTKARTAYAKVLAGIFDIVSNKPEVGVSQSVLGRDQYAFPVTDEAGRPVDIAQDKRFSPVPMFAPMLSEAAQLYGGKVVFGFNELADQGAPRTPAPPQNVIDAGRRGAGVEWQLNGNGQYESGTQVTSCGGRQDKSPSSVKCFNRIVRYGQSLVPKASNDGRLRWIEFWPLDAVGPSPMF